MNTLYKRAPDIIAADAAGKPMLLNTETWEYSCFNDTGDWLWQHLDQPRSLAWLAAAAAEHFAAPGTDLARDVEDFLRDASQRGLVLAEAAPA